MPTANKKNANAQETRPDKSGRSVSDREEYTRGREQRPAERAPALTSSGDRRTSAAPVRRDMSSPVRGADRKSVRSAEPLPEQTAERISPQDDGEDIKKSPPQKKSGADFSRSGRTAVSAPSYRGLPQDRRAGAAHQDGGFLARLLNLEPQPKRWHKRRFVPDTYKNSILIKRIIIAVSVFAGLFLALVLFLFVFLRRYLQETDDGIKLVIPGLEQWMMSVLRTL
ncbi:MAG: hypothetical protein LBQ91_00280 [Oscillospiraceae bacterium]|jgi:hypothetical protein|nr:hypothetical protein [Oscillospiraceae bacterium]